MALAQAVLLTTEENAIERLSSAVAVPVWLLALVVLLVLAMILIICNFDDRSFEINDEITIGFHDAGVAKQLEDIFERDAHECIELSSEAWSKRPIGKRMVERALYLFNEQL